MSHGHTLAGTTLRQRTAQAVADPILRKRVAAAVDRLSLGRVIGLSELDDPDGLRTAARAVKQAIMSDLPHVLETMADNVLRRGGHVHWADDAADANAYITEVAERTGAKNVVKSKSMATEETGLNEALERAGCRVVETDLGEWIIQLARETPSHIIAPALHHDRHSVLDVFRDEAAAPPDLASVPEELNRFARARLRKEFLKADMGVSGANFGVAETGSIVLVTNEGNGRMITSLPRVHVAVMGMERVVATWDQLDLLVQLLVRSATGQRLSTYTSILTGPRGDEPDGPDELHLVILDNGRSELLGTELQEMLNCIRCGACLNTCPVYRQVGGHSYGWVYSGPMGAVLTPLLAASHPEAAEVANASTLCGACMDACPVQIPLQDLLLSLRRRKAANASRAERAGWRMWSTVWSDPGRYRASTKAATWARGLGRYARFVPGASNWTRGREAPTPAKETFHERWARGDV